MAKHPNTQQTTHTRRHSLGRYTRTPQSLQSPVRTHARKQTNKFRHHVCMYACDFCLHGTGTCAPRKGETGGKLRGGGTGRRWAILLFHSPHVTPTRPAPAPGIISIIGVPFLQKDVSPRVSRAAPNRSACGPRPKPVMAWAWLENGGRFGRLSGWSPPTTPHS